MHAPKAPGLPAEPPDQIPGLGRNQGDASQWASPLRGKVTGLALAEAGARASLGSFRTAASWEGGQRSLSRTVTGHRAAATRRTPAADSFAGGAETHPSPGSADAALERRAVSRPSGSRTGPSRPPWLAGRYDETK